jgi:hypothetical protein
MKHDSFVLLRSIFDIESLSSKDYLMFVCMLNALARAILIKC